MYIEQLPPKSLNFFGTVSLSVNADSKFCLTPTWHNVYNKASDRF
jgi:hypothetical protein